MPLPRPRRAEMTDTPEFMNLVQELKGLIREESLAAMAPESTEPAGSYRLAPSGRACHNGRLWGKSHACDSCRSFR